MGPCNGDSGGGLMDGNQVAPPLLLLFQVVGITSWEARGCGHPEHPGVFLQVAQNTKDQVLSGLRPPFPPGLIFSGLDCHPHGFADRSKHDLKPDTDH